MGLKCVSDKGRLVEIFIKKKSIDFLKFYEKIINNCLNVTDDTLKLLDIDSMPLMAHSA
jgi:hypothetical protein